MNVTGNTLTEGSQKYVLHQVLGIHPVAAHALSHAK